MAKPKKAKAAGEGAIPPTPERVARGEVEALPTHTHIADVEGRPSLPYRAVDTLLAMEKRGTISPEMHRAGMEFRDDFAKAGFDPLRAPDLSRPAGGGGTRFVLPATAGQLDARRRINRAIEALGGHGAPASSCVWHVLGIGATIKDWAIRAGWGGRPLGEKTAAGILIGALGVLQGHYGY